MSWHPAEGEDCGEICGWNKGGEGRRLNLIHVSQVYTHKILSALTSPRCAGRGCCRSRELRRGRRASSRQKEVFNQMDEELMPRVASWGFVWSKVADLIPVYLFLGRTWIVQSVVSSLVPIDFVHLFVLCTCFWVNL